MSQYPLLVIFKRKKRRTNVTPDFKFLTGTAERNKVKDRRETF